MSSGRLLWDGKITSSAATMRQRPICPSSLPCWPHLNDVIAQMPYHKKATQEELLNLLPHKWKLKHQECVLTKQKEVVTLENQPCRLSFETLQSAVQTSSAATVAQVTKLFLSPDVEVKPGSKLTVTQDGVTTDYTRSGVPAVYPTHQEIILELFKEYA